MGEAGIGHVTQRSVTVMRCGVRGDRWKGQERLQQGHGWGG